MVVRRAVEADLPQLMALGRMLHEEIAISGWAQDLIDEAVKQALDGNGAVLGVIGPIGHLQGMIHLHIGRNWYSHDAHLEELYSYVHPDYRRSNNAKKLIDFAKTAAEKTGVPLLIGILSNHRTEQKIKLYQRRLGKPAGAYFLWNGKTGN
jgi:GNAT superfamily N-acetyltransferase